MKKRSQKQKEERIHFSWKPYNQPSVETYDCRRKQCQTKTVNVRKKEKIKDKISEAVEPQPSRCSSFSSIRSIRRSRTSCGNQLK